MPLLPHVLVGFLQVRHLKHALIDHRLDTICLNCAIHVIKLRPGAHTHAPHTPKLDNKLRRLGALSAIAPATKPIMLITPSI